MKTLIALLVCFVAASAAIAEPTKLTRSQASELFVALNFVEAGLNPLNTVSAADNINLLRPTVEALDKGKVAYQRSVRYLVKAQPADGETSALMLADELTAKADELVSLELISLSISDEEITAAKIKPSSLAVIRRWLLKPKK